jgi:hypothetical protein
MSKDFDNTATFSNYRWDQELKLVSFNKGISEAVWRFLPGIECFGRHWVQKDITDENSKKYPRECPNFNPENETFTLKNKCPCCERGLTPQVFYLMKFIDRVEQEANPNSKYVHWLDPIPVTVLRTLKEKKAKNITKKAKDPAHVNDAEYGCDLAISYDPAKVGTARWTFDFCDERHGPALTDEEKKAIKSIPSFGGKDGKYYDFSDEGTLAAYNEDTRKSLERGKYFEEDYTPPSNDKGKAKDKPAKEESDNPKPKVKKAKVEETESSEPAAPPVKAKKSLPVVDECPSHDDEHSFGSFVGDDTCNACEKRKPCRKATAAKDALNFYQEPS